MPIKFRQPQDINAIRFGATLVWGIINGTITIVTGASPLALVNALAKPIKKLIQYGKCTTVDDEIYCNNGKLVVVDDELPAEYQRQIGFEFSASTYYRIPDFHLRGTDTVRISFSVDKACNVFGCYTVTSAEDNYSLYASTSTGGKYLRYDGDTYSSYIPSSQVGERLDVVITPTGTIGMPTDSVITPVEFESVADLCIGTTSTSASSSKLDGNIWGNFIVDGRLTLIPCERLLDNVLGYYDPDSGTFYEPVGSAPTSLGVDSSHMTALSVEGTSEVLTIGEQTASVENLLAVDDIKDEQNIISGVVTHRCEAEISDGTTPSGRYIGTVGEGNIIVKARETAYEGDVVTFEADKVAPLNGLFVNVEPIQDLHGYDSPWPAGGGVNLLPFDSVFEEGWTRTENGITATYSNGYMKVIGTNSSSSFTNIVPYRDVWLQSRYEFGAGTYSIPANMAVTVSIDGGSDTNENNTFTVNTSVSVRGFYIAVSGGRTVNWNIPMTFVRGSTIPDTFAPYSNICPISGRTSATVTRTGKNLLSPHLYSGILYNPTIGTTVTLTDNATQFTDNGDGTFSLNTARPWQYYTMVVPLVNSQSYHLKLRFSSNDTGGTSIGYLSKDMVVLSTVNSTDATQTKDLNLVIPDGGAYLFILITNRKTASTTLTVTEPQLELGSSASAYEPYQGNTYTIQLGDTVYGGTLDVTGGKMVVDRAIAKPTISSLQSINSHNIANFSFSITGMATSAELKAKSICSALKYQTSLIANTTTDGYLLSGGTLGFLRLSTSIASTTEQAQTWVNDNNVQIVYFLATPIEITLTPTQISTLLGTNNVWSDAGTVKAYVADAELIEHVTPQPMRTAEGSNTVTVTSAVDPVQLEIDYYKDE